MEVTFVIAFAEKKISDTVVVRVLEDTVPLISGMINMKWKYYTLRNRIVI